MKPNISRFIYKSNTVERRDLYNTKCHLQYNIRKFSDSPCVIMVFCSSSLLSWFVFELLCGCHLHLSSKAYSPLYRDPTSQLWWDRETKAPTRPHLKTKYQTPTPTSFNETSHSAWSLVNVSRNVIYAWEFHDNTAVGRMVEFEA